VAADSPTPDVAARLRETAERSPDQVALCWHHQTISYRTLDDRVDAAAAALQGLGVSPGDRVALVLGNVPAFVEAHFATLRAGGTVVPLNTGLTADELDHALTDSGARVVVAMPALVDVLVASTASSTSWSPVRIRRWSSPFPAGATSSMRPAPPRRSRATRRTSPRSSTRRERRGVRAARC
jgi:acyl-CoA synthetase (AMP-forming)/AMP-acid ligase II